ncbi:lytic transglycosylase domain-containing protein [Luteirhabdus pelagi]|uniref:lytic transglycosylase domain-containing protein n=1 Tax=Luteirhabdus pelagi TaxID=2792783 RepID=UPI00193A2B0B|nr:lytic transglycosylase domain-containing protein [Luteirhabdus pelagi]
MGFLAKIGLASLLMGISFVCVNAVQEPPSDETMEKKLVNDYNVYAIPLPDTMDFAGEPVPMDDPDIRERFDRELLVNTYWQSNGLLIIKRANRFFPKIEPLLKKYGLPDDFKYLAVAESGLMDNSSPAGAAGFWHFLSSTGKEYGLEINDYVDERYNLEKATKVAAEYLQKSKDRFGTWTMAAAAYNAGNYGVSKQVERQKSDGDYYDLLLNDETSRYVFRILAFKYILSNPQKFGFNYRDKDLYHEIPTYTVKVDTAITDIPAFAHKFGISYKILKIHNPWLRETYLRNASGKEYFIEIPEEGQYTTYP